MHIIQQYTADAFTDKLFSGSPAAVCVMDSFPDDATMQNITRENNLSETAYVTKGENCHYNLRWFTPGGEIDLWGHATLASAFTLLTFYHPENDQISFDTLSGELIVTRKSDLFEMEFPAYDLKAVEVTDAMTEAFGAKPSEAYLGRDLLCVFDGEEIVRTMNPDQSKLAELDVLL